MKVLNLNINRLEHDCKGMEHCVSHLCCTAVSRVLCLGHIMFLVQPDQRPGDSSVFIKRLTATWHRSELLTCFEWRTVTAEGRDKLQCTASHTQQRCCFSHSDIHKSNDQFICQTIHIMINYNNTANVEIAQEIVLFLCH